MSDFSGPVKWPLLLLFAGGRNRKYNDPISGRTRMMKLVFLLQRKFPKLIAPTYDFEPYKYGPYSQDLFDDLIALESEGLVETRQGPFGLQYSLTPPGVSRAQEYWSKESRETLRAIIDTKLRFNYIPLGGLLDYVYEMYPEMAVASEREPDLPA